MYLSRQSGCRGILHYRCAACGYEFYVVNDGGAKGVLNNQYLYDVMMKLAGHEEYVEKVRKEDAWDKYPYEYDNDLETLQILSLERIMYPKDFKNYLEKHAGDERYRTYSDVVLNPSKGYLFRKGKNYYSYLNKLFDNRTFDRLCPCCKSSNIYWNNISKKIDAFNHVQVNNTIIQEKVTEITNLAYSDTHSLKPVHTNISPVYIKEYLNHLITSITIADQLRQHLIDLWVAYYKTVTLSRSIYAMSKLPLIESFTEYPPLPTLQKGFFSKKHNDMVLSQYKKDTDCIQKEIDSCFSDLSRYRNITASQKLREYDQMSDDQKIKSLSDIDPNYSNMQKMIFDEIKTCTDSLREMLDTRNRLINYDIINKNYRNLDAMTSIFSYFDKELCYTLSGENGAYYMYEQELKHRTIVQKMDNMIEVLQQIKSRCDDIYYKVNSLGLKMDELNNTLTQSVQKLVTMNENLNQVAYNTNKSAYYNSVTAFNSSMMAFMDVFD